MLRLVSRKISSLLRNNLMTPVRLISTTAVRASDEPEESEEEFNQRYEDYFNNCEIDGWQVRKGMNDLLGMDLIIDPDIIVAGLRACRRNNDIALAIRWLEGCKEKCGDDVAIYYPYLLDSIRPVLNELGIPTPEELGYDKPELWLKDITEAT